MNKPDSFILNNFDEEKLKHIIFYINQTYNHRAIIYGSVGFCYKMAETLFHIGFSINNLIDEDDYYKSLNENDIHTPGHIGTYIYNTPIICTPELNEINAVIVPDWGNFWSNYFKENGQS